MSLLLRRHKKPFVADKKAAEVKFVAEEKKVTKQPKKDK